MTLVFLHQLATILRTIDDAVFVACMRSFTCRTSCGHIYTVMSEPRRLRHFIDDLPVWQHLFRPWLPVQGYVSNHSL